MSTSESKTIKNFGRYSFYKVTSIEPEYADDGKVQAFMPQLRYDNRRRLPLNKYGSGPFCRFRIETNPMFQGVYVMTKNEHVVYVGECQSLSSRFNNGYGLISPRNCYYKGQGTNCKINRLIMKSILHGHKIDLWFHETNDGKSARKKKEAELMRQYDPPWNGKVKIA